MSSRDEQFRDFVSDRSPELMRLAYLLCGNRSTAEDLLQTALLRLYQRWRRVDEPAAYVRRILVTVAVDEGRRGFRRHERLLDELPERSSDDGTTTIVERDRLRIALASLPARQRAAVVLRHWLDLDAAAAAEILGCSAETVRSQAKRGLDKLRDAYGVGVATEGDERA